MIGRLARRPWLQLLLAGAVLWAVQTFGGALPRERIVVGEDVVQGLRQDHRRRTGRLPTPEEEAALVRAFADEEILYREALALGLDKNDVVVRRRLVQNMSFLLEESNPVPEPDDATLAAHLAAHPERFAAPERWSFVHVFVAHDEGGEAAAEARARELAAELARGADPARLGDPFAHGASFVRQSAREIDQRFGPGFASRVASLAPGSWSEPLASSYGLHLVRVTEHVPATTPELADVRAAVRDDWIRERRAAAERDALAALRERYEVVTEP